jgi:hypothetical protein
VWQPPWLAILVAAASVAPAPHCILPGLVSFGKIVANCDG